MSTTTTQTINGNPTLKVPEDGSMMRIQTSLVHLTQEEFDQIRQGHKNLLITFTQTIGGKLGKVTFLNPVSLEDVLDAYQHAVQDNASYADPVELVGFSDMFFTGGLSLD